MDPGEAHTKFVEGWPAQSWEAIERSYREAGIDVLAELARRVRVTGIGRSLGGIVSGYVLRCMMHQQMYVFEPSLVIAPNVDGTVTFTYEMSSGKHNEDWTATYPSDHVLAAFSRFLTRVGWVPGGHPAHAVLMGPNSSNE